MNTPSISIIIPMVIHSQVLLGSDSLSFRVGVNSVEVSSSVSWTKSLGILSLNSSMS